MEVMDHIQKHTEGLPLVVRIIIIIAVAVAALWALTNLAKVFLNMFGVNLKKKEAK